MTAKKGIKWNSERILSLSAMSISIMTLVIFIYQTNLMSKQNDLSILPYLQVSTSNNSEGNSYLLSVQNHGVGPAIIESVKLQYRQLMVSFFHRYLMVSREQLRRFY